VLFYCIIIVITFAWNEVDSLAYGISSSFLSSQQCDNGEVSDDEDSENFLPGLKQKQK
jgi:hypothetical protein